MMVVLFCEMFAMREVRAAISVGIASRRVTLAAGGCGVCSRGRDGVLAAAAYVPALVLVWAMTGAADDEPAAVTGIDRCLRYSA